MRRLFGFWAVWVLVLGIAGIGTQAQVTSAIPAADAIVEDGEAVAEERISRKHSWNEIQSQQEGSLKPRSISDFERRVNFAIRRTTPESVYILGKFKPEAVSENIDKTKYTEHDDPATQDRPRERGFQWEPAIRQAMVFLAVQHAFAMTQPKTREALRGPFFKDYFRSVKSLRGWDDGGKFFTNYIAHPMQGSFLGFIQVQNDPEGRGQTFGRSGDYWKSRMKALAWSAAWSTQFEIGLISQASIGNVGLRGKQTYVDIVTTPTAGIGMLIVEDILDKYIVRRIERHSASFALKILLRTLLNPTRSVANMIRFKPPWHRDAGLRF